MFFVPKSDYLALPRAPEAWVIEDLLPTSGLLNIYGQPKQGKSFISLQMASAIGDPTQPDFMSFPVRSRGPVAYLQLDTPRGIWTSNALEKCFAMVPLNHLHVADALIAPYPFNILAEGHDWLRAACDALNPPVVIIDTLREIHAGDENDSGHMRNVINTLVSATTPAALILISHARKALPDGAMDLMVENRGSSYIAGRMDAIMKVTDKRLHYRSRTMGEDSLAVKRGHHGLFELDDPINLYAERVIKEALPFTSLAELARELKSRLPKNISITEDACRSRLKRLVDKDLPHP